MANQDQTFVMLTPAFSTGAHDSWIPYQKVFIEALNKAFPSLKVIILSFHFPLVPARRFTWAGNEVVAFNGGMRGGLYSLKLWMQVWRELNRIRKQHRILGLFSFFCSESAFVGHYFARRFGLKHRIWILGQDARKSNNQVARIRPNSNELIAISDFLVSEFEVAHGIRPKHVIPIGINPESYYAPAVLRRDIDLLGVGSLTPLKRYSVFVNIVKEVSKTWPGITALICGGGQEHEALQAQIESCGLQEKVKLCGEQAHPEVLALMQRSRILLHPSSYEGFGMVCIESLYAGAHVISFCKPMNAGIAHWHIVSDEKEMLAKCLALLQNDSMDHSGVLPFNMDNTALAIMKLYNYPDTSASGSV